MAAIEPFEDLGLAGWRRVQAVNVESALLLTQAFAPGMRARGFGRVIFIVSNTFWSPPGAHMLAYIASKGALIGMARALAVGLGSDGIAVTAVAPGPDAHARHRRHPGSRVRRHRGAPGAVATAHPR